MRVLASIFSGLLLTLGGASAAFADQIGDATVISGTGTAEITATPVVSATSNGGWSSAYLFYKFDLYNIDTLPTPPANGPAVDIPMLITFSGYLAGHDTGYYGATAQIGVGSYGLSLTCSNADQSGCGQFGVTNQSFNFTAYTLPVGGPLSGTIFLSVIAQNEHAAGSASAWLDPVISFAPSAFLSANPNVGVSYAAVTPVSVSASATPEPATWLLMTTAVGAMGAALRARRRRSAIA